MNNQSNTVIEKNKCTGCQGCRQICPKDAIDIIEDEEGFIYPVKNKEKCIECGLCTKICPVINEINIQDRLEKQKIQSVSHTDKDVIIKSSSGGAFTSIVQAFCDKDYVIFGAKYGNKFEVIHGYIENINDIDIFRKSKYVQSNVKDTYKETKTFLNENKKVLFSGTPCQIAGLRNYLNKDYENLLCVDLVCHGVPSQKVFNKYIDFTEKKYKQKIKRISFREKTYKKKWNSRNILIEFDKDKKLIENSEKNLFLKGFHNKLFYRPSCKECKFANPKRYSDITIADCWGIHEEYPELDVHKGQSLMVVNTEKGIRLLKKINESQEVKKLTLDFAIRSNAQFREPTKFHKNRDEFFKNLDNIAFDRLIKRYIKTNYKAKIRVIISSMIPKFIKEKIKKVKKMGEKKNGKQKI